MSFESSQPLVRAAGTGNTQEVTRLLDGGADSEARDDDDWSALQAASSSGQLAVITELIRRGAAVNAADSDGYTALHVASQEGHVDVTRVLLQAGADLAAATKQGATALHVASESGHVDVTRVLLQAGADPATATVEGLTALHAASGRGHVDVTRVLLQAGADPAAATVEGYTALHLASGRGHVDVTRVLLQAGADPAAATVEGVTALHSASQHGHVDVTRVLLQAGADPAAADKDGGTPLMYAADEGCVGTVNLLLQWGSDTRLKDNDGNTALMQAEQKGHTEVVALFNLHARGEELPPIVTLPADQASPSTDAERQFHYGADHTQTDWSSLDKKRLADMCVMRILTAGDVEAGKSSLILSLLNNQSYLTGKNDRTEVVDCWNWGLPNGKVVAIYDIGGHPSYYYTCNYFHFDSANNVILLCHALLSEQYSRTFQWVQAIVSRSPSSHIIPVLTKADLAENEQEVQQRKLAFIAAFQDLLQKEVCQIDDISKNASTAAHAKLRNKYNDLSNSLSELVFVTSSAMPVDHDIGMKSLNSHIIKMSETSDITIKILNEFKEFYMENGVMGVNDQQLAGVSESKPKDDLTQALEGAAGQRNVAMTVASQEQVVSEKVTIHSETSTIVRKKYVYLEDAQKVYNIIAQRNRVDKNGLRKCLLRLHSYGMLLWFEGNPELEKLIFNDISFFKEILKAVFHHNALQFLKFQELDSELRRIFDDKAHFDAQVKMLTLQGIMTSSLLQVLLSKSSFHDVDFVLRLLEKLSIAYIMPTTLANVECIFIPYYVEQTQIPDHVKLLIADLAKCSTREMAVLLSVTGNFPSTFWHNLCVQLIKRLEDNAMIQKRIVFVNGLWAKLDHVYIYVKFENGKNIDITARCTAIKDGVKSLWNHLEAMHGSIQDIMNTWWPGIITNQVINCPHCLLQKRPSDQRSTWGITKLWKQPPNYSFNCDHALHDMPAALIKPLATDKEMEEKQLCDLSEFLQIYGTKKNIIQVTASDRTEKVIPKIEDLCKKNLMTLAYHIGHHWEEVGELLSASKEELEEIENEMDSNLINAITEMLTKWKDKQENAAEDHILKSLYKLLKSGGFKINKALGGQDDSEESFHEPGPSVALPKTHQVANISIPPEDVSRPVKMDPDTEDVSKCHAETQTQISDDETDTSLMTTHTEASTSKDTDDETETSLMTTHTEARTSKDTDDETETSLMTTHTEARTSKDTDDETDTSLMTTHTEASTSKDTDDETETSLMTTHTEARTSKDTDDETETSLMTTHTEARTSKDTDDETETSLMTTHTEARTSKDTDGETGTSLMTTQAKASTSKDTDDETDTSLMTTHTEASISKDTDAKGSEKPSQVNLTSETCPDITDVATLESTQVQANQVQQLLSTQLKEMEDRLMQPYLALSQQMYMQGKFHAEQADKNKMQLAQHADQIHMESAVHAEQIHMESAVHAEQIHMESTVHAEQIHMESAVHADQIHMESAVHAEQIHMESAVHAEQIQKKSAEHADQIHKELANKVALDAGDTSALENDYTHPVLKTNKALLEKYLCVTDDLLTKLFTEGLLWEEQMAKIQGQGSESGQRKLLLLFLDRNLDSDSDLHFEKFIQSCIDSNSPANVALVERINYDF